MFPVVAPVGTRALMLVALQLVGVAATPLNVRLLAPCVVPRFVPVIVTDVPTAPDVGFTLVRLGGSQSLCQAGHFGLGVSKLFACGVKSVDGTFRCAADHRHHAPPEQHHQDHSQPQRNANGGLQRIKDRSKAKLGKETQNPSD